MGQALQEELLQGKTGRILEAINNAEALIGRQEVPFPRIAVLGDESTGKSSLLEGICKIPFPRGSNVTTKCATQVRLQRKPGAAWSANAWTAGVDGAERRNQRSVSSPEEITDVISELQQLEIDRANRKNRSGTGFSTVPITISVEADNVVDLTIVDLPGYFQRTALTDERDSGKNAAWSRQEVSRVKGTLQEYIEDDNTILLVVVPANTNVKNANIVNLLDEYREELDDDEEIRRLHSRIIYCFTRSDLVGTKDGMQEPPQDIEEILRNKGNFASQPHGWYAVTNHCDGKLEIRDFQTRMSMCREYEQNYFDNTPPYNKKDLRRRCGTEHLVQKLSSILVAEIRKNLPKMLSKTDGALSLANAELKALGEAPATENNLEVAFGRIVDGIKNYYRQAGEGIYGRLKDEVENTVSELDNDALDHCKLSYRKKLCFERFKAQVQASTLPLKDEGYLQQLQTKVEQAVNGKFEETVPVPEVLFEEVRICAKRWKGLADALCDDIAGLAIKCINTLIHIKAGKYETLPLVLKEYLENMIIEQQKKAQVRLNWHYVDEIVRPNTLNDNFMNVYNSLKSGKDLGPNLEGNRNAFVTNLKAYLPVAEARYIDNVVRTITTHILDVPLDDPMTQGTSDDIPKFIFQASLIREDRELEELMVVRDDLAKKRTVVSAKVEELSKLRQALLEPSYSS